MRDNNTIRGIVAQILSKGEFPERAFELRDINNVKSFEFVSDERVGFRIKHRLGLFDHIFQKEIFSAYIPKTYVFELNISTEKVNLIEQIEGEPVIHFKLLAIEEIEKCFELYQVHDRKFQKTNFEKDVIEYAERELASIVSMLHKDVIKYISENSRKYTFIEGARYILNQYSYASTYL